MNPPQNALLRLAIPLASVLLLSLACGPAHAAPPDCVAYANPTNRGEVNTAEIDEASGLAASRQNEGVLWTHNDSGDRARLFALSSRGELLGTWQIEGARAVDWEDLALGPCGDGRDCLYIGDIGNNLERRTDLVIYRVPEPQVIGTPDAPQVASVQVLDAQPFRYPFTEEDPPAIPNAEALLVDPQSGAVLIATKENWGMRLLRLDTWNPDEEQTLRQVSKGPITLVTGGDFHPGGERFVLRTYPMIHVYDLSVDALPDDLDGHARSRRIRGELQGEAITYSAEGDALYTLAEGVNKPLWRYDCIADDVVPTPELDPAPEPDMGEADAAMEPLPEDMASVGEDEGSSAMEPGMEAAPPAGRSSGCAQVVSSSAAMGVPGRGAGAFGLALLLGCLSVARRRGVAHSR